MINNYQKNNVIEWTFEKIFDQLVKIDDLYNQPYINIEQKTFKNDYLHELIYNLTNEPKKIIQNYLMNKHFQKKFLFNKLKKKVDVNILLNDIDEIEILCQRHHKVDYNTIILTVLNDHLDIFKCIVNLNTGIGLKNDLLIYCSEYGYENMYFYLRGTKGLIPNLSVFYKAIYGNSLPIIKDINELIGVSNKMLNTAFENNKINAIDYLLNVAEMENVKVNSELISYGILNNNLSLVKRLEQIMIIKWESKHYFSAILSGSMKMIKYIETKFHDIHKNHYFDKSKTKKGQSSLLLKEIMYKINGEIYFSHTLNYAIQSGSVEIVKYILNLNYGITVSNFITAIRQGTSNILECLCQNYEKKLPYYLIHYLGLESYVSEKMDKIKILQKHDIINLEPEKIDLNMYKMETTHYNLILESKEILETHIYDIDFLMNYIIFFKGSGNKEYSKLISIVRYYLVSDKREELKKYMIKNKNHVQLITDVIYLFGNINQIQNCDLIMCPSNMILMELICYSQIDKLRYLLDKNLLNSQIISEIQPLICSLFNQKLNTIFNHLIKNPDPKIILMFGDLDTIEKFLNTTHDLNLEILKLIVDLDNISLLKKINIPKNLINKLIVEAENNDLIDVKNFLVSLVGTKK